MFMLNDYLNRLKLANISYEKSGTGQYKGDYYVSAGQNTPHLHISKSGLFVGLKGKKGAITTLVMNGNVKIEPVQDAIDELKGSMVTNDISVTNALLELARQYKQTT
jgi:hypothetical protein